MGPLVVIARSEATKQSQFLPATAGRTPRKTNYYLSFPRRRESMVTSYPTPGYTGKIILRNNVTKNPSLSPVDLFPLF
jgi:hypothetical protein